MSKFRNQDRHAANVRHPVNLHVRPAVRSQIRVAKTTADPDHICRLNSEGVQSVFTIFFIIKISGGAYLVHLFEMHGKYIAYDSESGSIHELDRESADVLNLYIQTGGKRPLESELILLHEKSDLELKEIFEICDDFDELIASGSIFASGVPIEFSRLYPEEPKIKAMCLHICHDCNLRCTYCFAGTGDYGTGHREMLSAETGRKAIDFLIAASGNRHHIDIDFFGGEPLMNWPVVVDLTHYCEEAGKKSGKDIRLTITTNALLLDDEKTEFINKHMKNCVLSIDGRPEIHNLMRPAPGGKPSYEPISKRIKAFIKKREDKECLYPEHYVRATFTQNNLDFSEDVKHIADALSARNISVEPVVAAKDCGYEIRTKDIPRIKKEYEELALFLSERRKKGDPVNFFHFNMDAATGPCVYKRLKGCGVGAEYCAVTPDGDIYPCHQFVGETQFCMGNVNRIDEILDESGHLFPGKSATDILDPEVRKVFLDRLMPNREECVNCFARYHCGGGCAANRYFSTGSLDEEYEIGCRLARKRLECSIWLIVEGKAD